MVYAQYRSGGKESADERLAYLNNLDQANTLYAPVDELHKNWDQTYRGLTGAGTAVVAIVAVAAVVATGGAAAAGASLAVSAGASAAVATGAGVVTATAASVAASTAAVSATNASMNADGDVFKQIKTINLSAWKETTSRESLRNIATAAATAALTAGIAQGVSSLSSSATTSTEVASTSTSSGGSVTALELPPSNTTLTIPSSSTSTASFGNYASMTTNSGSLATQSPTLTARFTQALTQTGIQGVSQAAAQSAINGDSFQAALKNQGKNILINAAGQILANEIGTLAHGETDANGYVLDNAGNRVSYFGNNQITQINSAEQFALHAALGCGMASAGGNNCGAGAAAGVTGELVGSSLQNSVKNEDISRDGAIAISQVSGALAAAAVVGPDDGGSVFAGSNIGFNAAANNTYYLGGKYAIPLTDKIPGKDYDLHFGIQGTAIHASANLGTDGFGLSADFNPTIGAGIYGNIIPHNEQAAFSITQGIKNRAAAGVLVTEQGNYGVTGSYGWAIPLSTSRTNVNIPFTLAK